MAKTPVRTRTRRRHRISQSLRAAVPQLDQLDLVQDEIGHWHLQARYEHWRPQPARQNEQDFSDGTLRLIGLLWSLLEGRKDAGPVLLEEPELPLHSSVVRQLPTILNRVRSAGGPQVLLTTHATDILQDQGLGKDEVVLLTPEAEGTEAEAAGGDSGHPGVARQWYEPRGHSRSENRTTPKCRIFPIVSHPPDGCVLRGRGRAARSGCRAVDTTRRTRSLSNKRGRRQVQTQCANSRRRACRMVASGSMRACRTPGLRAAKPRPRLDCIRPRTVGAGYFAFTSRVRMPLEQHHYCISKIILSLFQVRT